MSTPLTRNKTGHKVLEPVPATIATLASKQRLWTQMQQLYRGDGTTTLQLQALPPNGVFIVVNARVTPYTRELAYKLGRNDIKLCPRYYIIDEYLTRTTDTIPALAVDHAIQLTQKEVEFLDLIRIRPQQK